MDPKQIEQFEKLVDECAGKMAEFADSVRIFTTQQESQADGQTHSYSIGRGNYYAQVGAMKEWLIRQDEKIRHDTRQPEED